MMSEHDKDLGCECDCGCMQSFDCDDDNCDDDCDGCHCWMANCECVDERDEED